MGIYKAGDIVVCLPGFNTYKETILGSGAGSGYEEGRMVNVLKYDENYIVWPAPAGSGIFKHALRLATEHEIKYYKEGVRYLKDVPVPELTYEIF